MKNIQYHFSALLLSCYPGFTTAQQTKEASRPNIIVFIADDAGMDFGCYGNSQIKTPNIDRIARQGIRFEKAFLTSPQSSPSRTSMMTGMFAHTIGTEDLHTPIDDTTRMMPYYFRQAGYHTGSMLKTHWGAAGNRQFDTMIKAGYDPNGGNLTHESFAGYEKFIEKSLDKPFFLWVGFVDPHRPYFNDKCPQINNRQQVCVPPYLVDAPATRRDLADYYDEISRMDSHIGQMMDYLEQSGKLDNTIVVFLSDNGMPFPRAKGTLYDSGIQTPLLFMWKGKIKEGASHNSGLVSTVDLLATLLDLANIKEVPNGYGKTFKHLLFNPSQRGREVIFAERNWHDSDEYIRCIRTENHKLIYNAYYHLPHGTALDLSTSPSWYDLKARQNEGKLTTAQTQIFASPRPMIEFYNLATDPFELNNLSDKPEYQQKIAELSKKLVDWQQQTNDHPHWKRRRADMNDRITGAQFSNHWSSEFMDD